MMQVMSPRPAPLLTALLVFAAVLGCSSEDDSTPAAPTSTPTPTATAPTQSAPPDGPTPGSAEPVLEFASEGRVTIGCNRFVDFVEFDQFTASADVELVSVTAPRARVGEVGRAWVSDDPEQLEASGSYAVDAKGPQVTDEPGWRTKRPVSGYPVESGTDYTVFVELSLPPGTRLPSLTMTYLQDGVPGAAEWPISYTRKKTCA